MNSRRTHTSVDALGSGWRNSLPLALLMMAVAGFALLRTRA